MVVAVLGALYAVAATAELVLLFLQTRGATGLTDLALQLVLVGVIVASVYLVVSSVRTLGWKRSVRTAAVGDRAFSG